MRMSHISSDILLVEYIYKYLIDVLDEKDGKEILRIALDARNSVICTGIFDTSPIS